MVQSSAPGMSYAHLFDKTICHAFIYGTPLEINKYGVHYLATECLL